MAHPRTRRWRDALLDRDNGSTLEARAGAFLPLPTGRGAGHPLVSPAVGDL